jgi:methylenetetrahydrofolate reductase (NADPH)
MGLIRDIHTQKAARAEPAISFEFFPPKTEEGERNFLSKTVPTLAALKPDFCSVTYGAGGSTRAKTLAIVDQIQRDHGLTALAHLTCVGSTREQLLEIARQARALGIQNILALRGDPPVGSTTFEPTQGGFEYAWQLVALLREFGGFCVGVAGFPEGHIACTEGRETDWDRVKAKVDQGADFIITQLFFNNAHYFRFRDYLSQRGVTVPIFPGIIPILSASQIKKFTSLCGAELPEPLLRRLDELGDVDATVEFGIDYASRQCEELLRAGVPGLHFYSLNKARSITAILKHLNLTSAADVPSQDRGDGNSRNRHLG